MQCIRSGQRGSDPDVGTHFQLGNSSQHCWDFSAQAGADRIRALARIPNLGILRNTLGISQRGPDRIRRIRRRHARSGALWRGARRAAKALRLGEILKARHADQLPASRLFTIAAMVFQFRVMTGMPKSPSIVPRCRMVGIWRR